jgi:uncharacterized damage-inducible protein DinB
MKNLIVFIAILGLTFITGSALAQFTQSEMLKEWQRAKTYTKAYLDAMPEEDYGFKPTPEIRSFAEQMLHLAWTNYFFASWASGESNAERQAAAEKTPAPAKEGTTKIVMDSYDFVISTLQGLTPDQLNEILKRKNGDQLSKANVYGKAFEHQTHHRGQTTIYLRLKGIVPPAEILF